MKRYFICFLVIILCLSCLIPVAFAETKVSAIQPDGGAIAPSIYERGPVIVVFDPNGHIVERIYDNAPIYYYEPEKTTNNTEAQAPAEETKTEKTPEVNKEISNELAKQIFELTNAERKKAGLNKLTYNFDLQESADLRAKESATLFDHTRPNGESCYSVFNVDYNVAGENLIKADKPIATAENLMKSWMESEGHRANILLPEFTSIAIGVYEKDDVIYASQLFVG